jgi:hypothetical protein
MELALSVILFIAMAVTWAAMPVRHEHLGEQKA